MFGKQVILSVVIRIEDSINNTIDKTRSKFGWRFIDRKSQISLREMIIPLLRPRFLLLMLFLSLSIHIITAFINQILFCSLGYDLPIIVNIFLTPIFFFIYLLPISFGSLGIREGANIVLYGLFGVPAEIALLISFYNLSGILLNNAIGGILILVNKPQKLSQKTIHKPAENGKNSLNNSI